MDFPDRPADFVGGSLLEQEAHCASFGGAGDIRVVAVRGEHEHPGRRDCLEQLAGGLQAIEQGHRDVHQYHIGTKLLGQRDGLAPVLRLADHLQVVFKFEHLAKAFAHDHVVFRQ